MPRSTVLACGAGSLGRSRSRTRVRSERSRTSCGHENRGLWFDHGMAFNDRTMAFREVGDLFVLVNLEGPPSDREFDQFLLATQRRLPRFDYIRTLVYTLGGAPTPVQ